MLRRTTKGQAGHLVGCRFQNSKASLGTAAASGDHSTTQPKGTIWQAEASLAEERSPVDCVEGIAEINFEENLFSLPCMPLRPVSRSVDNCFSAMAGGHPNL